MRPWRISTPQSVTVDSVARSHVGLVRVINEDRVFDCPERGLWAVADGMGGHSGGDLAAQAVIDALRSVAEQEKRVDAATMLSALKGAHATIMKRNKALSLDAGTTVVAAQLSNRLATIAWAGDSRAYLIRGGTVTQLTHDHSFVQDLIDAGLLTVAAAARHPRSNVVTRALGVEQGVELATVTLDLTAGDRLLLCSDGLSRSLPEILPNRSQPSDFADALMSHALHADGSDNVSLVCVTVG